MVKVIGQRSRSTRHTMVCNACLKVFQTRIRTNNEGGRVIGSKDIRIKMLVKIWKMYCQVHWITARAFSLPHHLLGKYDLQSAEAVPSLGSATSVNWAIIYSITIETVCSTLPLIWPQPQSNWFTHLGILFIEVGSRSLFEECRVIYIKMCPFTYWTFIGTIGSPHPCMLSLCS